MVLVVVLGVVNVWQTTSREVGPDPELEALHSPEEAAQRCRVAIDSVFAIQSPSIVSPLETDYLQGGEYAITGTVELLDGGRRIRRGTVCELQFRAETGWRVEHVALDPG